MPSQVRNVAESQQYVRDNASNDSHYEHKVNCASIGFVIICVFAPSFVLCAAYTGNLLAYM